MITPEQRAGIYTRLAERKTLLEAEVRAKQFESRELARNTAPGETVDGGDSATSAVLAEVDLAEAERDLGELAAIAAAEVRLANSSYGLCVDCGTAIAPARLNAHPTASRCTACQTAFERKEL